LIAKGLFGGHKISMMPPRSEGPGPIAAGRFGPNELEGWVVKHQDHGSEHKDAAPANPVENAVEAAKELIAGGQIDQLRTKAVSTAANLYREGRDFLANNEEVGQATAEMTDAIRRNPLAAVGIAFTAGLVLALLTRG
jgi:ElaB/YqjD/DUF883 family membrane-anchored ribosome-binding protein